MFDKPFYLFHKYSTVHILSYQRQRSPSANVDSSMNFNLLTGHKLRHQSLQDDLQMKTISMGLTFKPKKCRSLSICGGKSSNVDIMVTSSLLTALPPHQLSTYLS